ncbi:MAG TPA: GyrI-like domain-containing protein [Acidimicrobiia bacterium]|jgi:effector-binding domain-containing protein
MYQVTSRHVYEQPTLVMTGKMRVEEIKDWIGTAYARVAEQVGKLGLTFAGPPFARYRPLDESFEEFEIEAGFPIDRPASGVGEVTSSSLPGGTAAVVTHIGPYDQMRPAYEAIQSWIEAKGGTSSDVPWEVYYSDPVAEPDPSTWRTEIYQPYIA